MLSTKDDPIEVSEETNHYEWLDGGQVYFGKLIDLISQAENSIHFQLYRFEDDLIGLRVQQIFLDAADRGVDISIVVDGYGSKNISRDFIDRFKAHGIRFMIFSPINFHVPFMMGRRLHHKFLLVDNRKALIGGINVADEYHGTKHLRPWLDFAILLEGPVCYELKSFADDILNKTISFSSSRKKNIEGGGVAIHQNDILRRKMHIRRSYYENIYTAKRSITIVAAYFIPRYKLLQLLFKAARKGVEVRLVLPALSDTHLYEMAVKHFYSRLLKHQIKIFEYESTILHAKVAVIDDEWATIGSYNLNDLSDLLSTELNVAVRDKEFAAGFAKRLNEIIEKECVEVEPTQYLEASWFNRMRWRFYYRVYVHSIRLLSVFTSRERRNFLD